MPNEFKVKNGLLVDQGGANITGSSAISGSVSINSSGSGVFTVDGTAGRLFSVDDSLSGSLFSVNTAAGLPVIEAFSDNTVRIGQFGQRSLFVSQSKVGVGKETSLNGTLDVSGSLTVTGSESITVNLTIGGNLVAQQFIISSSVSYITTSFSSGSTKFGDTADDIHQFTGSLQVTGSFRLPTATSNPTGTQAGQLYYNTSDNNLYRYNGTTWIAAAGFSGTSGVSSSGTSGTFGF